MTVHSSFDVPGDGRPYLVNGSTGKAHIASRYKLRETFDVAYFTESKHFEAEVIEVFCYGTLDLSSHWGRNRRHMVDFDVHKDDICKHCLREFAEQWAARKD